MAESGTLISVLGTHRDANPTCVKVDQTTKGRDGLINFMTPRNLLAFRRALHLIGKQHSVTILYRESMSFHVNDLCPRQLQQYISQCQHRVRSITTIGRVMMYSR